MDKRIYWFNYVKQDYEYVETPTDFSQYIPQSQAAQSLYTLLINHMNKAPIEAALHVLNACVGESNPAA